MPLVLTQTCAENYRTGAKNYEKFQKMPLVVACLFPSQTTSFIHINKPLTCIVEEDNEKTLVKVSESKAVSQATFLRQLMSAFSDSSPRYVASAKAQAEKETQVGLVYDFQILL